MATSFTEAIHDNALVFMVHGDDVTAVFNPKAADLSNANLLVKWGLSASSCGNDVVTRRGRFRNGSPTEPPHEDSLTMTSPEFLVYGMNIKWSDVEGASLHLPPMDALDIAVAYPIGCNDKADDGDGVDTSDEDRAILLYARNDFWKSYF